VIWELRRRSRADNLQDAILAIHDTNLTCFGWEMWTPWSVEVKSFTDLRGIAKVFGGWRGYTAAKTSSERGGLRHRGRLFSGYFADWAPTAPQQ